MRLRPVHHTFTILLGAIALGTACGGGSGAVHPQPAAPPVLSAAAGHLACTVTRAEQLGSHSFYIGEVTEVGGEPDEVLRMEDTRMHYGG